MQRTGLLARRVLGSYRQQAVCAQCACSFSASPFAAQPPQSAAACDVPEGHANSDLRNAVSNISLNRRRDISLRSDVLLYTKEDEEVNLRKLLKIKNLKEVSKA